MFSRFLAASALSIVAIAGVRYYCDASAAPRQQQAIFPEDQPTSMTGPERARCEQLLDSSQRRGAYAQLAEHLAHALEAGTMGLGDATERLFYFCLQNYPEHLEHVAFAEQGEHIKTKLARNLVRAFPTPQAGGAANAAQAEVAVRLDRELHELPYEADSSGRVEPH
jgi:hypothetical protein